jgi:hypothetical protein
VTAFSGGNTYGAGHWYLLKMVKPKLVTNPKPSTKASIAVGQVTTGGMWIKRGIFSV